MDMVILCFSFLCCSIWNRFVCRWFGGSMLICFSCLNCFLVMCLLVMIGWLVCIMQVRLLLFRCCMMRFFGGLMKWFSVSIVVFDIMLVLVKLVLQGVSCSVMLGVFWCSCVMIVGISVYLVQLFGVMVICCCVFVGLKVCWFSISLFRLVSVVVMVGVSFWVLVVGCMLQCLCMNSGFCSIVCSWVSVLDRVGCVMFSCLVVWVMLCFFIRVRKIGSRFRLQCIQLCFYMNIWNLLNKLDELICCNYYLFYLIF